MLLRRLLPTVLSCCALAALAACSGAPERKVHPSTATIQQLAVQPDGRWKLVLRIQNFSTFPMHYRSVEAKLAVDGREAGELRVAPDIDIVGDSGDVVEASLAAPFALPAGREFGYTLKGTIETSEPEERFEFDRASRLSPVPGVADTWR
jgi:hypothetical protein